MRGVLDGGVLGVRDRLLKLDGLLTLPVDDHVLYIHFVGLSEIS